VSKKRMQILAALIVGGAGALLAAIAGLWIFMSATARPLHPDAQKVPSVTHAAPSPGWADAVERGRQIMRAELAGQNLPGLSVAVGVGGDFVWAEGFGWADLEQQVPVAPDTRFRIGTASTALTSAAVGLLLDQDRLKLDEDIQTYVPEFPKKQWPVTLRQLMGHLAGVRNDRGDEGPLAERCERTIEGLKLDGFAERPLLFEPGTHHRYSSYGWILVSAAVEAAANRPFLTFMRKQIFEPLGMIDTEADSATEPIPNRATSYFPRFAADPRYGYQLARDPESPLDFSCYAGASVFLSTPSDLVRFGIAVNGGTLPSPTTVQLLQTSQRLPSGEETGYGLGWDLETVALGGEDTTLVGHDGTVMGGVVASLMTFREHGIVVSVMSNTSYADTFAVGVKVAEAFVEQRKRPTRK
jgi:CubicO group peptidase (beta-lactamase class C family)